MAAAIADAVGAVPGVVLTAGSGTAVATQYRGGSVAGVSLGDDSVTVQIVAEALPLPPLVDAVHAAVLAALARAGDPRVVHVYVADLDLASRLTRLQP